MRRFALAFAAVVLTAATAAAAPMAGKDTVVAPLGGFLSQSSRAGSATTLPVAQTGGTLAPLTAQECTALGGEVAIASFCNSRQSCQRKDENGKDYEVCLSTR